MEKASDLYQEIPQSHTADQPTAPQGRATEHWLHTISRRQLKQSNQLSRPHSDDYKARMTQGSHCLWGFVFVSF